METVVRSANHSDVVRIRTIASGNPTVRFLPAPMVSDAIIAKNCVVATWKERVVGFLMWRYHREEKTAEIVEIAVDTYSQHRGVGTHLLNHLKKECKRFGYMSICYKHPQTYPEPRFILRSGFTLTGQEKSLICTFDVYRQELSHGTA